MKKISLLVLILTAPLLTIAQDKDPWMGDWTSESYSDIDWEASNQKVVYANFRLVLRITKNGDKYYVRAKIIKINDPNFVNYRLPLTVTSVDNNTMYLESFVSKDPFRVNGEIDEYSDITYYFKLTLDNGVIHYHHYRRHTVYYDRNLRYKGQKDIPTSYNDSKLDLFNDNW